MSERLCCISPAQGMLLKDLWGYPNDWEAAWEGKTVLKLSSSRDCLLTGRNIHNFPLDFQGSLETITTNLRCAELHYCVMAG